VLALSSCSVCNCVFVGIAAEVVAENPGEAFLAKNAKTELRAGARSMRSRDDTKIPELPVTKMTQ
jgi:hypothetical protein